MTRPKIWPDPQTADPLIEPSMHRRVWSAYLKRGLTRASFAREVGVDYSTAFAWDMGKATPDLKKFLQICEVVGYSPNEIAYGRGGVPGTRKPLTDEEISVVWRESQTPIEAATALARFKRGDGAYVLITAPFARAYFAAFSEQFDRESGNAEQAHAEAIVRASQSDALAQAAALGVQPVTPPPTSAAAPRKRNKRKRASRTTSRRD